MFAEYVCFCPILWELFLYKMSSGMSCIMYKVISFNKPHHMSADDITSVNGKPHTWS